MSKSEGLEHAEGASTRFMVASGVLFQGCGCQNCCVCIGLRFERKSRNVVWIVRCCATPSGVSRPSDSFLSRFERLDHAEGFSTRFMFASVGVLSEGYGHGGPDVCLSDGQTEAEGVPSQGGRGDALLRRMPPYLT